MLHARGSAAVALAFYSAVTFSTGAGAASMNENGAVNPFQFDETTHPGIRPICDQLRLSFNQSLTRIDIVNVGDPERGDTIAAMTVIASLGCAMNPSSGRHR